MTDPVLAAEQIMAMGDDEFAGIVDDDIRERIDGQSMTEEPETNREKWEARHAALRSPLVRQRWYDRLVSNMASVDGQLATKEAEVLAQVGELDAAGDVDGANQARLSHNRWKRGALRFRSGLEQRLLEAERLMRPDSTMEQERNRALGRVVILEDAIRAHRDAFPSDDEASDADHVLWKHID